MRVVAWNAQWGRGGTSAVADRLARLEADVVCLTEGRPALLPAGGETLAGGPDFGYRRPPQDRKVLLWSRTGWTDVDAVGDPSLPPGRFVAGTTIHAGERVRVIGVCVPWQLAHVSTGRRDRLAWGEHLDYLRVLGALVRAELRRGLVILAGDLNQRIPSIREPREVAEALGEALGRLSVATAGVVVGLGRPTIDHVCHTKQFSVASVRGLPAAGLSDHDGVVVDLGLSTALSR